MNVILGLDIGTEFVKAVLARADKKGNLEILGAAKARQQDGAMHAGAISDIPAVVSACEEALVEVEDQSGERASTTVVGVAGELIKGNTTSVNYTRKDKNRPITEAEMSEILKKVQQKSGEVVGKEIALETGSDSTEVSLISSAIVSLTIDGYKITNPIGFKGSKVSILIYTAFAPMIHVSAIEKVCAELNLDLLTVAVEPFAVCRACLGDNTDSEFSGIIVDIGSHTTDVAVINGGVVEGTKAFSVGAAAAKKNPAVWLSALGVILEESIAERLPGLIYLCGGGAAEPVLQEQLATSDWYESLPFARRPVINLIDVSDLPNLSTAKLSTASLHALDYSYATALGLIRVGVDTLAGSPDEHGLRSRLAKLLQN
ncbi:hypothetical protein IJI17_03095 [Candidatus Saccharibacteria bacterium]|nr:hypothetical protein [Candidatus Saccharibacteria bacterium]MBQ6321176.1 hypothetical protein [Candidatus Saccharibacteria bacterium]